MTKSDDFNTFGNNLQENEANKFFFLSFEDKSLTKRL